MSNLKIQPFSLGLPDINEEQDDFLDSIESFLGVSSQNPAPPSLVQELNAAGIDRRKFRIPITMEERYARTQEKNIRAQKRFREKQKVKYSAMEVQVEQLNQKIQGLEIEKKELQDRTSLLERILRDREKSPNSNTTKNSSTPQNSYEPIDQAADSEKIKQAEGTFYFSTVNKIFTSDMIRNLHLPEVSKYLFDLWEEVIMNIANLLQEADVEKPQPEKIQQLQQAVTECNIMILRMYTINPIGVKHWACKSKYNPYHYLKTEIEVENFTEQIIEKLELNESQKGVITFLWNRFSDVQEECMKQRKELAVQLQNLARRQTTQWKFFEDFIKSRELLFQIRENWRQEYRNHWDMILMESNVLTPIQEARLLIYMYPILCDDFIFSRIVARQVLQKQQKQEEDIQPQEKTTNNQQKFYNTENNNNIFMQDNSTQNVQNIENVQSNNNSKYNFNYQGGTNTMNNIQVNVVIDNNNNNNNDNKDNQNQNQNQNQNPIEQVEFQRPQKPQVTTGIHNAACSNNRSNNNNIKKNCLQGIDNMIQNTNDFNQKQIKIPQKPKFQETNVYQIQNQKSQLQQDFNISGNNSIDINCITTNTGNNNDDNNNNNNNNNITVNTIDSNNTSQIYSSVIKNNTINNNNDSTLQQNCCGAIDSQDMYKIFENSLGIPQNDHIFGHSDSFDLDCLLTDQQRDSFNIEGIIQSIIQNEPNPQLINNDRIQQNELSTCLKTNFDDGNIDKNQ